MLAITDGDGALAQSVATDLGQQIYAAREALLPRLTSVADALTIAKDATGLTVLADTAARAKDLDEAAAQAAKQRAEEALKDRTGGMDLAEAQAELLRAVAQLRAIEKLRKMKRG